MSFEKTKKIYELLQTVREELSRERIFHKTTYLSKASDYISQAQAQIRKHNAGSFFPVSKQAEPATPTATSRQPTNESVK